MEELNKQVTRARRRLILQQYLRIFSWAMFMSLLVGGIAIAIPKIWVLEYAGPNWTYGWLAGSAAVGLLLSLILTYRVRRSALDAAIEIDHRFGLKERVSSTLSLDAEQRDSAVGRALVDDAVRRVSMVDVREAFDVNPSWRPLLPLATGVVVFLVALFVPDATREQVTAATETAAPKIQKQIQKTTDQLRKELERKKKEAEERGLAEAESIFDKLQRGIDEMAKRGDVDRKKALVEINDLAKELAERRDKLGGVDDMRKQLDQLKDVQRGPADQLAQAMKNGDLNKALDELKRLQEKLNAGDLDEQDKKKLAEQLNQMQKKLQDLVDAQQQAKRDLEEQIKQKREAGDLAAANDLQRKLDQLSAQSQQMSQLQDMANQMGQCAECMKNGDQEGAAKAMAKMSEGLQDLQSQMDELATLDGAMDALLDAKSELTGGSSEQDGMNMGMGMNGNTGQRMGRGMGEGQGVGDRPEEETETGAYESRVGATPKKGEAIRVGDAFGPNLAGKSTEQVKEELQGQFNQDPDPIINQRLPRREQRQAAEYLERLRTGEKR